jgi:hypothetical protein
MAVIHVLAVVAESLPSKLEKMERFDAHIRATDAAPQGTPEVFQSVCMNTSVKVLDGVIYNFVRIVSSQTTVGTERME